MVFHLQYLGSPKEWILALIILLLVIVMEFYICIPRTITRKLRRSTFLGMEYTWVRVQMESASIAVTQCLHSARVILSLDGMDCAGVLLDLDWWTGVTLSWGEVTENLQKTRASACCSKEDYYFIVATVTYPEAEEATRMRNDRS